MEKSGIAVGQMFIHFDNAYMEKPKVWVKVKNEVFGNHYGEDKEEVSLFVDNDAMAKFGIDSSYRFGIRDKWSLTDGYYLKMVRAGKFVPVDDLARIGDICQRLGWPEYEIDLGF